MLRLGTGGALAAVLAGGAGWLDRRDDGAEASPPPMPSTTSTTTSAAPPSTTADITDPVVALGLRVVEVTGIADVATPRALIDPSDGEPFAAAAATVSADFAAGRTLDVDGWILAVSEAHASAIIALTCTTDSTPTSANSDTRLYMEVRYESTQATYASYSDTLGNSVDLSSANEKTTISNLGLAIGMSF